MLVMSRLARMSIGMQILIFGMLTWRRRRVKARMPNRNYMSQDSQNSIVQRGKLQYASCLKIFKAIYPKSEPTMESPST